MKWEKKLFKKPEPSYATGFVCPKTTSLFFDKIWLTDEEANRYKVPPSLRLSLGDSKKNQTDAIIEALMQNRYKRTILPNRTADFSTLTQGIYFSRDRGGIKLSELKRLNDCSVPEKREPSTRNIVLEPFYESHFPNDEESARALYSKNVERMRDKEGFLTSFNRNEAIREISNYYNRRGIQLTPIFFEQTDFEKSLLLQGPLNNSKENAYLNRIYNRLIPERDANAIVATIKSIPVIVEDSLLWDQVEEIRRDKKSIKDLKRFRTWALQELKDKSLDEITDILDKELDDYKYALKKHGVLTTVGGFTTVLSMASTIAGAVEGNQMQLAAAGFSITAGIVTFSAQQLYEYFDTRRQPIAYIYNIINK